MSKEEATFEDVALATRHGKEAAIAAHLRQVGLLITVPPDFPSDDFGTFSGERERPGSQFETAVAKARKAIELTGLQKAVASEGAYGPHPVIPFVPLGRELVVLLDAATETVVEGWWSGTKTNFRSGWVSSLGEAEEFAQRLGFPGRVRVPGERDRHSPGLPGVCGVSLGAAAKSLYRSRHARHGESHSHVRHRASNPRPGDLSEEFLPRLPIARFSGARSCERPTLQSL